MIINPDENATDTKSLKVAIFKEKCVPIESGRFIKALWETYYAILLINEAP